MNVWYVDSEECYAVDLDKEESAIYDQGDQGKRQIAAKVFNELGLSGRSAYVTLFHANGSLLYDIKGT